MDKDEALETQKCNESRNCESCLDWHKFCKAECCSIMKFNIGEGFKLEKGSILGMKKIISKDMIWYYKLHGIKYYPRTQKLHVLLENYEYKNGWLTIFNKCTLLSKDYKCLGHPHKKPEFCKFLKKDTALDEKIVLTDNCVFKYQVAWEQLESEGGL